MADRSYPTNVVQLAPEANALVLQIAAARAQLAQDVADKIREDLDNFKIEVRASLHVNANLTGDAISRLDAATVKCNAISERLVTRLTVLEGRALQRSSSEEIVVSLAETQLAEQKLEIERGRQEIEREKIAFLQAQADHRATNERAAAERKADLDEKREARAHKWGLVKQWTATLSSSAVVLAVIAFIAQKC